MRTARILACRCLLLTPRTPEPPRWAARTTRASRPRSQTLGVRQYRGFASEARYGGTAACTGWVTAIAGCVGAALAAESARLPR